MDACNTHSGAEKAEEQRGIALEEQANLMCPALLSNYPGNATLFTMPSEQRACFATTGLARPRAKAKITRARRASTG